jgi:hypothetical protein
MAELKTKPTGADVTAFLNGVADEQKRRDCFTLVEIMREATGAEPQMWGDAIVGFGSQHYRYASGREGDWPIIGFSPRKQNLTLYLTYGFEPYGDLLAKLGKHSTSKACLYVKRLSDVDMPTLRELVRQTVAEVRRGGDVAQATR